MQWEIVVVKDGSTDPYFNVSVSCGDLGIYGAIVEVVRLPPQVSFKYPEELKENLSQIDQKKLELEILNKIVEYLVSKSSGGLFKK